MTIPSLGAGTYRLKGEVALHSVSTALQLGYRHIDTAQIYENEAEVGQAIAESGVKRSELFVTTKIWVDQFAGEQLIPSLKESLRKLQLEQVDLTLIHWPSPGDAVPVEHYIGQLARAQDQGLTRLIGVSNFTRRHLKEAWQAVGKERIATNQVELHPFLQNKKLVEFAREHGLHLTAYMPLAYGRVLKDPTLQQIAHKHGVSAAQVTLAWLLAEGHAVIPSSSKKENLEANLQSTHIQLSSEERAQIAALDRGERLCSPEIAPQWDEE